MTSGETGLSSYKESKCGESKQPLSSRDNNKMKRSLSLLPSIVHSTQHTRLFVICLDVVCVRGMSLQVCLKGLVALCFSY